MFFWLKFYIWVPSWIYRYGRGPWCVSVSLETNQVCLLTTELNDLNSSLIHWILWFIDWYSSFFFHHHHSSFMIIIIIIVLLSPSFFFLPHYSSLFTIIVLSSSSFFFHHHHFFMMMIGVLKWGIAEQNGVGKKGSWGNFFLFENVLFGKNLFANFFKKIA